MIEFKPVTRYEMKFAKGKPLPLYFFYTLLGQDYQVYSEEPYLLKDKGDDPEEVLDMLHIALNGFPRAENIYSDNVRAFKISYGSGNETKIVRAAFYIDDDTLACTLQRARKVVCHHLNNVYVNTPTHTTYTYGPSYCLTWDWEDLAYYGLVEDGSDIHD